MLDFGQIGVQNNERQPTEMVNETGYFVTINQQVRMAHMMIHFCFWILGYSVFDKLCGIVELMTNTAMTTLW